MMDWTSFSIGLAAGAFAVCAIFVVIFFAFAEATETTLGDPEEDDER
jgi:hypothetical protein